MQINYKKQLTLKTNRIYTVINEHSGIYTALDFAIFSVVKFWNESICFSCTFCPWNFECI